ncbi:MAG: hypothetical protein GWO16_04610, partial [Gammaproteobacteria bacterium]|nr:hypothetical protein [Gammaproteobacteria bacterium]NIR97377.1 hypothetical protein [Gammaproteobacteria bacterium]NIT63034.1 hypothetical protein [Gammaproteobacteria bacterium]NIV19986.1 hypothetical protein [Gammaproteobacteria bacterium]NIY31614.1 hypothetical protein [Gammaproteobacteria bacterium]
MDPRLIRKVRRRDRIANWVITAGGLFVIVCVLGILVLIARVALPLFDAPEFSLSSTVRGVDSDAQILAVGLDEYKETAYTLDARGHLRFYAAQDGTPLARRQLASPGTGEARLRRADWFRKGA